MKYWAFISYSHQDRRWAERLHRALESYRLPTKQIAKQNSSGEVIPRRLTPIFIDRAELASSSSLEETLHSALLDSRFLIVLCSPAARASTYVEEEIREFQRIGRQAQILPVIVDWGPRRAVEDVFPRPLCGEDEPLAADVAKDGFHNAKLKLIAGILGIGFDQLKHRDRIRTRWRRINLALRVLLVLLCLAGAIDAGAPFPLGDAIRRLIDQHQLSVFRRAPSAASLSAAAASLRQKVVPESVADLEGGDVLAYTADGHVGGTWDLGQIAAAITAAPEANTSDLDQARQMMDGIFQPGRATEADGIKFGWLHYKLTYPQAEDSLWPIIALCTMLQRPGYLSSDEKTTEAAHLRYAEQAANLYFMPAGGWDYFPRQQPPQPYGVYTTLTGLDALLAVRDAQQTWLDAEGNDRLTQMTTATVNYLLSTYDRSTEWSENPGWHGTSDNNEVTPNLSLTLLAYTLLLQASLPAQEQSPVWPLMLKDMAARIEEIPTQQFATDQDMIDARYIGPDGVETEGAYQWKLEQLPWAISFANAWMNYLTANHAPTADVVEARRVLGVLLKEAGPVGQDRADFYRAELLYRLDHIQ